MAVSLLSGRGGTDALFLLAAFILAINGNPYDVLGCVAQPDVGPHAALQLAAGTASAPYQYRALVPWFVGLFTTVPSTQATVFAVIAPLVSVGLSIALRVYVRLFLADLAVASVAALSAHAVLPLLFLERPYYPYDLPSVLLFTLGLIAVHRRGWIWFSIWFAIATLNRETSLLLTVAFVAVSRERGPRFASLLALQVLLWTAIEFALWRAFRDSVWLGYGTFELPLITNARALTELSGRALLGVTTGVALSFVAVRLAPRISNEFLRRGLMAVPAIVLITWATGFLRELRVYGEVLPLILVPTWVALVDLMKRERTPAPAPLA